VFESSSSLENINIAVQARTSSHKEEETQDTKPHGATTQIKRSEIRHVVATKRRSIKKSKGEQYQVIWGTGPLEGVGVKKKKRGTDTNVTNAKGP